MSSIVRVRFAPSPTGPLHMGGVRTALFNYLFAKKHNGVFVLRIEDTDQTRYVGASEKYILDSLNWCGISFDESVDKKGEFGPYRQSQRKELYRKYIDILLEKQKAYYAFDTTEELEFYRKDYREKGKNFIYNHETRKGLKNSLSLSERETQRRIDSGEQYAVRFKIPQDEVLILEDQIRGNIKLDANTLDDKVLFKSDGMPTYHLANVVDDHLMKISHVIRGEEWLPSLGLHVLLYRAFGWDEPKFAHLPLILKPAGKGKLSKRDGAKLGFPVLPLAYSDDKTGQVYSGYREEGYFADAFVNMLALLGWNPGTEREIFSLEDLVNSFDLKRVNKSGAIFSTDKAKWFNQQYLQKKPNGELANLYLTILKGKGINSDKNYVEKVVLIIKERAIFVDDFWQLSHFFFVRPKKYDAKVVEKQCKSETLELIKGLIVRLNSVEEFNSQNVEGHIKDWITSKKLRFGEVMKLLRLSLVGDLKGPNLFDIMEMIGKKETIERVSKLGEYITQLMS